MGYTHYWYRPPELEVKAFDAWRRDVRTLHQHLPAHTDTAGGFYRTHRLTVHGPFGQGEPIFREDLVAFNGRSGGRSALDDLGHETFCVERSYTPPEYHRPDAEGRYFAFCKTARKPYDLLVAAALIALKEHFPGVKVLSDGNPDDWQPARELTRRVLRIDRLPIPNCR